jgi:type I restriction enzyme S subunit
VSNLPDGWAAATLKEVASWGSGGTPSRSNPNYYGGGIPWLKTGELGQRFVSSTEETISEEGLKNSSAKLFPAGAVAIAMYGATIGKTSILGIDAATNQACAVGIPNTELTSKEYLYHYLCSQKDAFVEAGKGGAQPNISQSVIKDWDVPLAPLPEQKRIANKLDAVLARVDACRDRLDRIPVILRRFRQSVLAAATSGKLTEEWRVENDVCNEWSPSTVGDAAFVTKLAGFEYTKFVNYREGGDLKVLKAENAGKLGFKYTDFSTVYSKEVSMLTRSKLQETDVLMVFVGAGTGQVARVPSGNNWFLGPNIALIRTNSELLNSAYLEHYCRSQKGFGEISSFIKSVAQPSLSMKAIRQVQILLPSTKEQTEIIRRVEALFAFADRLEVRHTAARAQVEKLTPATLAKAFRGELVPQDPNDEPASALLERISTKNLNKTKNKSAMKGRR